jgi:hypothetical protein
MSFLTPFFFVGLAAVLVPILIHLVRRARAPRIEFPSLMFVRQIPQRTIRRRRLQNLLLLLLRCLALAALVLAFVRPYVSWGADESRARGRTVILLLDRSFSMRAGDGAQGRSRFAEAVEAALAEVDRLSGEDEIGLVLFDDGVEVRARPGRGSNEDRETARGEVRKLLREAAPGDGGTDFAQAIRSAEALLRESTAAKRQIFLYSDLQAAGLIATDAPAPLSRGIELLPRIVGESALPNLAVSGLSGITTLYQARYADPLRVRLTNHGDAPAEQVRVEFLLNEQPVEERQVTLRTRETGSVTFTGFNLNPGINSCAIRISGSTDRLAEDNRFLFTLRRTVPIEALVIETATRGRSESFYLRYALTTGENLPFQVTVRTAGTIDASTLSRYGLIIVNDARVSSTLATQIRKAVEAGAGLILATGPHAEPSAFAAAWGDEFPVQLQGTVTPRGGVLTLGGGIRRDHPIFELFGDGGPLASGRIFGYHRVTAAAETSVLARFDSGDPAILEWPHGRGRMLLLATTLDASWNDLPLRPAYLPLMRQMTRYLVEREERPWHPVGAEISLPATASDEKSPPLLERPDGERIRNLPRTSAGDWLVRPSRAGLYRLRREDRADAFAVNIAPTESDLRQLEVAPFLASWTAEDRAASADSTSGPSTLTRPGPAEPAELEARQQLWLYLLAAALLLFLSEGVVARRIRMARVVS